MKKVLCVAYHLMFSGGDFIEGQKNYDPDYDFSIKDICKSQNKIFKKIQIQNMKKTRPRNMSFF